MQRLRIGMAVVIWAGMSISACAAGPGASSTSTSRSPLANASVTPSPLPTLTVTATPRSLPEGAGLVAPSFAAEFHARLGELPAGQYLILVTLGDETSRYKYIGLDGQQANLLFTISASKPFDMGLMSYNSGLGFIWWRDESTTGMLFLDLRAQQLMQFNTGCRNDRYFTSSVPEALSPGGRRFSYSCDEKHKTWYVVSVEDWSISSYMLPDTSLSYGDYHFKWVTDDLALVWDGFGIGVTRSSENVCALEMSRGSISCFDDPPYWIEPISLASPDGRWVVVQYEDPADTGEVLSGLLPVECLERPQASCKPTAILDSVVAGSRSWEAAYWSPDGRRLATVDYSACATDFHETKLWIYDLETQGSHLVGDYPNQCLEPGPGPWTADGSRFMLIDYGTSDDYRIWLASVATGSLTRVAASSGGIIGVTGFFQVP